MRLDKIRISNRLNKNSDAEKALYEYMQKSQISNITLANLYKAQAIILISSKISSDIQKSVSLFKKAAKYFTKVGLKKGVGVCKFGLAKIYWDRWNDLPQPESGKAEEKYKEQALNMCINALKLFKQINWPLGEFYASKFEEVLMKLNLKRNPPKPAKYYIELGKLAKIERDAKNSNSWISAELGLLVGMA